VNKEHYRRLWAKCANLHECSTF